LKEGAALITDDSTLAFEFTDYNYSSLYSLYASNNSLSLHAKMKRYMLPILLLNGLTNLYKKLNTEH
jgi:hypothetical protein